MKNTIIILSAALLALSACSSTKTNSTQTDSTTVAPGVASQPIFAKLKIKDTIKVGDSVLLKFTVYNTADTAQQFCKWHTPFEPLMSKYLEVRDASGTEMDYKGAMAKRIMPPPADSYIKVNPKDSLAATANLLKAFAITNPSTYTVKYTGQNMSGLAVTDSVKFVYVK